MSIGAYVKVFDDDGYVLVPPAEEPRIDAAVTAYLDSGGTRDSLLRLTTLDGAEYVVRVSSIRSWIMTTPEARRRQVEHEKALADERREYAAELGYWEDSE